MSVAVTCQRCQRSFSAAPHLYGKTVACPNCQAALTVPNPNAPSAFPDPLDIADPLGPSTYNMPASLPSYAPAPAPRAPKKKRSSNKALIIVLSCLFGGLALIFVCGGLFVWMVVDSLTPRPQTDYASLMDGRRGFRTALTRLERAGYPAPQPPPELFTLENYRSPVGELAAYVSPPPGDGQKHPAIIWVFGGFDNSIGKTAWEPAARDNDQSARAFREAGLVMMYPSFRGGNMNPGNIEAFYGEVDDLLAAADHLARKSYVDPQRIYLGGHSTGGTMAMLAAAATDRFRAVIAFGPIDDVTGYGTEVLPFNPWKENEATLRNPIQWLHAMKSPVFVFEGGSGNASCLRSMKRDSTNPQLHFFEVRRADHFNILAPITALIAEKMAQDTGAACNLQFTETELNQRF